MSCDLDLVEEADPLLNQERGGGPTPDSSWYKESIITNGGSWPTFVLYQGFNITIAQFELADWVLEKLIINSDAYTFIPNMRTNEADLILGHVIDQFEDEFEFLRSRKVPRTWRLSAIAGWARIKLYNLQHHPKKQYDSSILPSRPKYKVFNKLPDTPFAPAKRNERVKRMPLRYCLIKTIFKKHSERNENGTIGGGEARSISILLPDLVDDQYPFQTNGCLKLSKMSFSIFQKRLIPLLGYSSDIARARIFYKMNSNFEIEDSDTLRQIVASLYQENSLQVFEFELVLSVQHSGN